jgi:hypothetical protein
LFANTGFAIELQDRIIFNFTKIQIILKNYLRWNLA